MLLSKSCCVTAHSCIHDDVLADHDDHFWDRQLVGIKNASAPSEPEKLLTRRQLLQTVANTSSVAEAPAQEAQEVKRRQLETKAQYLARPWQPIRINVQFVNVGSDSQMDPAKTNFLTNVVIPQAVAKLEAALEVSFPEGPACIPRVLTTIYVCRCGKSPVSSLRIEAAAPLGTPATATSVTLTTMCVTVLHAPAVLHVHPCSILCSVARSAVTTTSRSRINSSVPRLCATLASAIALPRLRARRERPTRTS